MSPMVFIKKSKMLIWYNYTNTNTNTNSILVRINLNILKLVQILFCQFLENGDRYRVQNFSVN